MFFRLFIPGTHVLTEVAAEYPTSGNLPDFLRKRFFTFYRMVSNTTTGIHPMRGQRSSRTGVHTTRTGATIRVLKRLAVTVKKQRGHNNSDKTKRPFPAMNQQRIFSNPPQSGPPCPLVFKHGSRIGKTTSRNPSQLLHQPPQTVFHHQVVILPISIAGYQRHSRLLPKR